MRQLKLFLVLAFLAFAPLGWAQKHVLTEKAVLELVQKYHPAIGVANLIPVRADAGLMEAKGGFDPRFYGSYADKDYQNSEYFELLDGGLEIPTWFGLSVKTGFEQNSGEYLNPENVVPGGGLIYAGGSLTLGRGLMIDKRRAELLKAKIYVESSALERMALVNQTLFEASQAYWAWVEAWHKLDVFNEAVRLTQERFRAVKISNTLGDAPAIDTLESFLQVQNRQLQRDQQRLEIRKREIDLNAFLWFANNQPLQLTSSIKPPALDSLQLSPDIVQLDSVAMDTIVMRHPELMLYEYKNELLTVDRRMSSEALKPELTLSYNALTEPVSGVPAFSRQNVKWGMTFSYPILMRSARGALKANEVDLQINQQEQSAKRVNLWAKVDKAQNEIQFMNAQVISAQNLVRDYRALLRGEQQKFDGGESSLFLINSREQNVITSRIKYIDILTKRQVAGASWRYATASFAQ